MAQQIICDLCGKPITNNDIEEYKYAVKKKRWRWDSFEWEYIDVHESCRKKLFNTIKESHSQSIDSE